MSPIPHTHTHTHTHISIPYICIYTCMCHTHMDECVTHTCMSVRSVSRWCQVCVRERERDREGERKRETSHAVRVASLSSSSPSSHSPHSPTPPPHSPSTHSTTLTTTLIRPLLPVLSCHTHSRYHQTWRVLRLTCHSPSSYFSQTSLSPPLIEKTPPPPGGFPIYYVP